MLKLVFWTFIVCLNKNKWQTKQMQNYVLLKNKPFLTQ